MSLGALSLDSRDLLLLLGDAWKEGMEGGKRRHLEPGAELDALKFKVPPQLILKTGVCAHQFPPEGKKGTERLRGSC